MKKRFVLLMLAALLCWSLCACADEPSTTTGSADLTLSASSAGGTEGSSTSSQNLPDGQSGTASPPSSELALLSDPYEENACTTENGYYYLTGETFPLRDGNYGAHLMYMDFATGQEIYLCSTAGCQHDSQDCPAVFLYDDFPPFSTLLFTVRDHLYILSREHDEDGIVSQDMLFLGEQGTTTPECRPAALYRANLDGTQRQKVFTFDENLAIEDKVIGSGQTLYVVAKRLSADQDGGRTYTTSSERKLMALDLNSFSLSEVCSMDFGDSINWKIMDCWQNQILLCGLDFGRELSRDEAWDEDVYRELYANSDTVYALWNLADSPREVERLSNREETSARLLGDCLYVSTHESQDIHAIHLDTGERDTLCFLSGNLIMGALGERLCCRKWELAGYPTWYFVDTKTGEISQSPLTVLCNGWSVDFRGETARDALFIYDYDATANSDGSYEIYQYKYALIDKDKLFSGSEDYRPITMTGPGQ